MYIDAFKLPKAYSPLTDGVQGVPKENVRFLEGRSDLGYFLFDPIQPEYVDQYDRCKQEEKIIRAALHDVCGECRLPFKCTGGSNTKCLKNQGMRKLLFLLRPLKFDVLDDVPKDDRMPQHAGNTNIALHVDEDGTYQLTRWWRHTKSKFPLQNVLLDEFAQGVCQRALETRDEITSLFWKKDLSGVAELFSMHIARSFNTVSAQASQFPDWYTVEIE